MTGVEQFLTDFTKDIIHHPMERQELIAGWAKRMEAREKAARLDVYDSTLRVIDDPAFTDRDSILSAIRIARSLEVETGA